MPRRSRRRIVGKWERIEQEAREDELRELERELHGEQRGQRPKPRGRYRRRPKAEPSAPDAGTTGDGGSDDQSSDG